MRSKQKEICKMFSIRPTIGGGANAKKFSTTDNLMKSFFSLSIHSSSLRRVILAVLVVIVVVTATAAAASGSNEVILCN